MLLPYKSKDDKIVMGLLSYIERFSDMEPLMQEMSLIQSGKRQVSLWRDDETENVIGLVGYDLKAEEHMIIVRYLALSPSFRGEGVSYAIMSALAEAYPEDTLSGTLEIADFLNKWALYEQRTVPHILSAMNEEKSDNEH